METCIDKEKTVIIHILLDSKPILYIEYEYGWYQNVSEYDQEIPQSQTADPPTAPWSRAAGHLQ